MIVDKGKSKSDKQKEEAETETSKSREKRKSSGKAASDSDLYKAFVNRYKVRLSARNLLVSHLFAVLPRVVGTLFCRK